MPTTPLQRMMFLQGQLCFFCERPLPKAEASIEHLVPSSSGGSDHPDNLVACCRTVNALFGNMSFKEKVRAILKQNGRFTCPNQPVSPQPNQASQLNGPTAKKPAAANANASQPRPPKPNQPQLPQSKKPEVVNLISDGPRG